MFITLLIIYCIYKSILIMIIIIMIMTFLHFYFFVFTHLHSTAELKGYAKAATS